MDLLEIKGIGPKTIALLNKISINTVDDLLRYFPYRYNVYSPSNINEVNGDDEVVITGIITSNPNVSYIRRNFNRLSFQMEANNNLIKVVIFNRAFMKNNLSIGKYITLIGKYNKEKNTFTASDIKFYKMDKTEVEPVYHMVSGLKSSTLRSSIDKALMEVSSIDEILPSYINEEYKFMDTFSAIKEIHKPGSSKMQKMARLKLKYEELFVFSFKINLMKYKNQLFGDFVTKDINEDDLMKIINDLPFKLTNDQIKATKDILNDFRGIKRMNRLILGDVGSGKTIVSFIAVKLNKMAGYQSAILAPTEVLAKQHFENIKNLFKDIKVELLVGSLKKSEKNKIIEKIKNNEVDLVIGTHALLEENVTFNNLGLVITDEQHRFGVNQRKTLQNKGRNVDVLYMSATPIPRTYALTIYGDMDISLIKEKPAGRKDIKTSIYKLKEVNKVASLIEEELLNNHQAYVVSPLIEENDESNLNDILKIEETLKQHFKGNYNIGILHGKMKSDEKESIMEDFKEGKINVLIATTVIEVGVDVKNATMMVIFNAERFGLATIHQLRGRVGRNTLESKCILVSDSDSERLKVIEESNDGFYISEKDFYLRGSGDLFGVRQSGDMIFKIADIRSDFKILLQAKKDSEEFLTNNIENNFREYPYYNKVVNELLNND